MLGSGRVNNLARSGWLWRGGVLWWVAVKVDVMEAQVALGVLVLLGNLEGDLLGSTALGVADDGTARLARGGVLAVAAVRHGVDEVNVDLVDIDRDLELLDGEVLLGARNLWAGLLLLGNRSLHALGLEGPLGEQVTLAKAIAAAPSAAKVKVLVLVEFTGGEVDPSPAALLVVITLVVRVIRASEWLSIRVP